jgi:hypothetical protein
MGLLDPKQWLLSIGLCVAAVIGVTFWAGRLKDEGYNAGYSKATADYTAKTLVAEQAAREREQALTLKFTGALNESRKREQRLRIDGDALRSERDRLLRDLAASTSVIPTASCDAVRKRAAALTDVFGECATQLEELAGKADRHASDSLTLQQSWPAP